MVTAGHGKGQMDTEMDTVEPRGVIEALNQYCEHRPQCSARFGRACDCGLFAALRAGLDARNAALEEAAEACLRERIARTGQVYFDASADIYNNGCNDCAEAIRALKT